MASIRFSEAGEVSADKPTRSYSKTLTFNVTTPREVSGEGQARSGERGQGRSEGQRREGGQRGERGGEGRGEGRMQRQQ